MAIENFVLYQDYDPVINLLLFRGDSYPISYIVKDRWTKQPINITGASFLLTANSLQNPEGVTEQKFQVIGVIDSDQVTNTGAVSFTPSSLQTDIDGGAYYFDIQAVDESSSVRTILKAPLTMTQDITKNVSSVSEYTILFDNDDLVGNVLTVTHNLNDMYPVVTVYDNNNDLVSVSVVPIDNNSYTIDFGGPITGTWLATTRVLPGRLSMTFDNGDLVGNILTVVHSLGTAYPAVVVYDDSDEEVSVNITSISTTQFSINFTAAISGTWHLTAI